LVSYGDSNNEQTQAPVEPTFTYSVSQMSDEEGGSQVNALYRMSGHDGCNAYTATISAIESGTLTIDEEVNIDGAFCEDLQNSEYLTTFDIFYSVVSIQHSYSIESSQLVLTAEGNQILRFAKCSLEDAIEC